VEDLVVDHQEAHLMELVDLADLVAVVQDGVLLLQVVDQVHPVKEIMEDKDQFQDQ
jgi:hypothetical protein